MTCHLLLMACSGHSLEESSFRGYVYRLFLSGMTTSNIFTAFTAKMTRATMIEVMNEDYIRTARAKGLCWDARACETRK